NFLRLAHATDGLRRGHFLARLYRVGIFGQARGDEGRLHASGTDAIHADAVFGVVQRHALRQAGDGEFGGAVSDALPHTHDAANGREVDDVARFSLQHCGQENFGNVEHAAHVDRVKAVQVRAGGLEQRANVTDAGVVDQDIEPPPGR